MMERTEGRSEMDPNLGAVKGVDHGKRLRELGIFDREPYQQLGRYRFRLLFGETSLED